MNSPASKVTINVHITRYLGVTIQNDLTSPRRLELNVLAGRHNKPEIVRCRNGLCRNSAFVVWKDAHDYILPIRIATATKNDNYGPDRELPKDPKPGTRERRCVFRQNRILVLQDDAVGVLPGHIQCDLFDARQNDVHPHVPTEHFPSRCVVTTHRSTFSTLDVR